MDNEISEPEIKYNYLSPEEYLTMERASGGKHEYYKGKLFAMSGASVSHNDIAFNINRLVAPFVHGKGCKLYGSDFRIHIPGNTLYTYPDFSIVCGKAEINDTDNLLNPSVIIEILSRSTQNYDRGAKFDLYKNMPALKHYVLIDSISVSVEIYTLQDPNTWVVRKHKHLFERLTVPTINLTLSLEDIYLDVSFPA